MQPIQQLNTQATFTTTLTANVAPSAATLQAELDTLRSNVPLMNTMRFLLAHCSKPEIATLIKNPSMLDFSFDHSLEKCFSTAVNRVEFIKRIASNLFETSYFKEGHYLKAEAAEQLRKLLMPLNSSQIDLGGLDLSGVDLHSANLSGMDLYCANLRCENLSGANLNGTDLSGANLIGANLNDADLSGANLNGADLSSANLRAANLSGANLNVANLSCADLQHADLDLAKLNGANLNGANLRSATLVRAELSYTNLSCADLNHADLRYADLGHADLKSAKLTYADVRDANLKYANLNDADLCYAHAHNADLNGTNLIGAIFHDPFINALILQQKKAEISQLLFLAKAHDDQSILSQLPKELIAEIGHKLMTL